MRKQSHDRLTSVSMRPPPCGQTEAPQLVGIKNKNIKSTERLLWSSVCVVHTVCTHTRLQMVHTRQYLNSIHWLFYVSMTSHMFTFVVIYC